MSPPPSRCHRGRPLSRSRSSASGLDEPAADRVAGERDAVAQPELVENVLAVALNGVFAEVQHLGDLAAAVALGDQLDHLGLALGQRVAAAGLAALGALEVLAHERTDSVGV